MRFYRRPRGASFWRPQFRDGPNAMPTDGRNRDDERRDRGGYINHDRGMTSSTSTDLKPKPLPHSAGPAPSSAAAVCLTSTSSAPASRRDSDRDRETDRRKGRSRERSPNNKSQIPPRHRRDSRNRIRQRSPRPASPRRRPSPARARDDDNRRQRDRDRERDRIRDKDRECERQRDPDRDRNDHQRPSPAATRPPPASEHHGERNRDRDQGRGRAGDSHRPGRGSRSPPSFAKLPRSRSPAPSLPRPDALKPDRRDRSPPHPINLSLRDSRPQSPHRRSSPPPLVRSQSPGRRNRRKHRGTRKGPAAEIPRGRSRSPGHRSSLTSNPNLEPLGNPRGLARNRSPGPQSRRRSRSNSRRRSPPPSKGGRSAAQGPPSESKPRRARSPEGNRRAPHRRNSSPSPRGPRDSEEAGRPAKRIKRSDSRDSAKSAVASGANSVELNMPPRGGFRGGFNGRTQGSFPVKAQYQGSHDGRRFSHSSGHATPTSNFHGSPPPPSPFSGSQGWSGQNQYSPHSQYPAQGAAPPTGPQNQFHQGSAPFNAPTGPNAHFQSYPTGPSRGNFRGGPGGFRGSPAGPRGGRGGGFKSGHWNAKPQGSSGHTSPTAAPKHANQTRPADGDTVMGDDENPFRPSKDLQVEDTSKDAEHAADEKAMAPPTRAPPTGPQSSKFSFAFKAASKPAPTTPKAEIAQKFNAAPQRREALQNEDKDRRDLPRSVPTEPASSRARHGRERERERNRDRDRNRQDPPPEAPKGPRTRKVKKIMKKPKPRPQLPEDLAKSTSVFYRKPGDGSVVGSGTYGKVFKGLNVYTKSLVALKKIKMEGERDGFPVTAVREIKLLQSLKHINIVKLQEVMVEQNDCFMVFEYLSHDLTGLLHHPTFKLDAAQKKHLAKQLFEGLDYLHKRGVLHRDIKAANILVSSDGILKIADFGLARFYAKRHQLDYTNRVVTIWYRSPELLLGETQYGPAVDVWSAACVMVEIFTKHAIFPGDGGEISQLDKIYAILGTPNKSEWPALVDMPWFELLRPGYKKPNVFAEKYRDRLPPAAFDLLAATFQYDPAKRPTASDVLEHPYFTTEEPAPRQAVELAKLDGDWHEFESKALRREKERKEKEAREKERKQKDGQQEGRPQDGCNTASVTNGTAVRQIDKKRPPNDQNPQSQRDAKRQHMEMEAPPPPRPPEVEREEKVGG